jgi:acetyl-CoA carboxylase biotin carboxyl carrier protein
VPDLRDQVDALAALMDDFHLREASLTVDGVHVAFKRVSTVYRAIADPSEGEVQAIELPPPAPVVPTVPAGTPVSSPMNGIFYDGPSPSSPAFVKVGDSVTAGQVIGLIEAMKVFNEIPCTASGVVLELVAKPGSIVQPGDVLLYVG